MEWPAILLSLKLASLTTFILVPLAILLARWLAWRHFAMKGILEALVALPLVLPPTVLGYYLLVGFGRQGWLGQTYEQWVGSPLTFSFGGLLLASLIFNLPFAVQPAQRAFESIQLEIRESAWCCGLTPWQAFWKIELPLARNGVVSSALLTFAHTVGEFGVVLMVGGNIPGETRTLSIAIFNRVEAFDHQGAGTMSLTLLLFSMLVIACVYTLFNSRVTRLGNQ